MYLILTEEELAYLRYALVHSQVGWRQAENSRALIPEQKMGEILAKIDRAEEFLRSLPEEPRTRALLIIKTLTLTITSVVKDLVAGEVPALFFIHTALEELEKVFNRDANSELVAKLRANLMQELTAWKSRYPEICKECGECESEALKKTRKMLELLSSLVLACYLCFDELEEESIAEVERELKKEGLGA